MKAISSSLVTSDMLFDHSQKVFDYIKDYAVKYAKVPDIKTVEDDMKTELDFDAVEPLQYYEDKLISRTLGNKLGDNLKGVVKHLEDNNPEQALEDVKEGLRDATNFLSSKDAMPKVVNLKENVQERLDDYSERKRGLKLGLPLPWEAMTNATGGCGEGQLWAFIARLKTGKSFMVSVLANHFYQLGHTPLVVSLENPIKMFERRTDAIISHRSIDEVRKGHLGTVDEVHFRKTLREMETNKTDFYVAGNGRIETVSDVELLCQELKPKILLIDGFYFLKTGDKILDRDKYGRVANVVNLIQGMTQRLRIPVIVTGQFNKKITKKKEGSAGEVAFSYELPQSCDVLISMGRDQDDEAHKKMKLSVIEVREGFPVEILIEWDLEKMNFREVGILEDGEIIQTAISSGQSGQNGGNQNAQGTLPGQVNY